MSSVTAVFRGGSPDLRQVVAYARAGLNAACRVAAAAIAVWLLAHVRSGSDPQVYALTTGTALLAAYVALGGTSFRVWALYLIGFILFAKLRGWADGVGAPVQFDYAATMEETLFLGVLPSVWLQERLYSFARLGPVEAYTIGVYLSYFFAPHAVAFALWRFDRERFKTYAFSFMATLYIGLLTCAVLPTAPPWMAAQMGYIRHVYQVLPDIAGEVTPGTYHAAYELAGANNVAAMPSLHAAIPFLMAIALWKYRGLRWLGAAYAASMLFSIVYLGEHYAVDGLVGWAIAGAAWAGVTALLKELRSRGMLAGEDETSGAALALRAFVRSPAGMLARPRDVRVGRDVPPAPPPKN